MIKISRAAKTIAICTGAGCRAWDSEKILAAIDENLRRFPDLEDYTLRATPCMSKCGGGASIKTDSRGTIVKARDIEDAVNILFQEQTPAATV